MGYVMSTGMIYLYDRYIGNTPTCELVFGPDDRNYRCRFSTDEISEENLALFADGTVYGSFKFVSGAPHGDRIDFFGIGTLRPVGTDLKSGDWMRLSFEFAFDGITFHNRGVPLSSLVAERDALEDEIFSRQEALRNVEDAIIAKRALGPEFE